MLEYVSIAMLAVLILAVIVLISIVVTKKEKKPDDASYGHLEARIESQEKNINQKIELVFAEKMALLGKELREENFHVEKDEETQAKGTKKGQRSRRHVEQYFAVEARDALRKLALKRHVTLRAEASRKDPQGRLLADVVLEDGTSLAAFLVENGFAYVVHDPHFPQGYLDALYALQQKAMQARRGFWGRILELEAARLPWTGNTETRLFYSGNDVRSQQIKPRLRMYFGTLLDAFSSGYAPARSRDFWPAADKK